MINFSRASLALCFFCACAAFGQEYGQGPERYIVRYAPGAEQSAYAVVLSNRGTVHRSLPRRRLMAVSLPEAAVQGLRRRSDVELLEIDPKRYTQAEQVPYGIELVQADPLTGGLTENSATTRKICIMDSGYDSGHEDLPMSTVTGDDGYPTGCSGPGCTVTSGTWDEDGHGHGTHVSGTILALGNNNLGVVGVNPGTFLKMHMVKVFNNDGNWAYGSDLIWALDQCLNAGAQIISMSLGGSTSSEAERGAFEQAYEAGVLAIAAAGNAGSTLLSYPASYDAVMSVAAVDSERKLASFSQFNHQVEIAAPGVGVLSTLPGDTYAAWDGTSMAAPHVSGVAALVWGHHETCTAAELRAALTAGATDLGGPGWDSSYGHGLVQAWVSETLLRNYNCAVPPPPPVTALPLENGVPVNIQIGERGDEFHYVLEVPAGATDLRIMSYGGTGDADLYVRHGFHPTADHWDCRPYINGNSETCVEATPAPGAWHVMLRGFIDFTETSLVATYQGPDSDSAPQYFLPDADIAGSGAVSGSFAGLGYNDGVLQTVTEVESGGKPSRRYSEAEHQWRIPGVTGGSSVNLQLVAASTANSESDHFTFDISYDEGLNWDENILQLPQGGALKTYWVPLPATTRGIVLVRARDTDHTPRALKNDVLYLDLMNIVTVPDANDTPPNAPLALTAEAVNATSVRLMWQDISDNEQGFEIRRWLLSGSEPGDLTVLGTAPANTTTWIDDTVAPSTSYQYAVAAITTSYSSESNRADVTTPDGIFLEASSSKHQGRITVTLSWNGATEMDIWRSVDDAPMRVISENLSGTSYIDETGLKGSPLIRYQVCASQPGGTCSGVVTAGP